MCICGMLLMVLLNKFGLIVLMIGNKSEMVVGYCMLYGDMVGGFVVIKDIVKMFVYWLCCYCNVMVDYGLCDVIFEWILMCVLLVELCEN